jgi:CDP-glucose 4,6-dehydratase
VTARTGRLWLDRRVFVTGATGLLGSWLVRSLVERGALVVCLVRDWVPESELLRTGTAARTTVVRGEVQDQALVERTLAEYEIETVFHLAAQTIVGVANGNPISTFDTNIRGTWSVLEACRRSATVHQIVVASSDKAYGASERLPYAEDAPLRGTHPYDVSKSCADLLAQAYATTYALPVVVTRCGNLFGGGDLNWNRLVPGTIRAAIRGERPVIRSNGKSVRDYFYVEDAVLAYLRTAEQLVERPDLAGQAFNFSAGQPLTVLGMAQRTLAACGRPDLDPDVRATATHEIPDQSLDSSKAKRLLGWSSTFGLDEGLARTVAWYRELLGSSSGRE